MSRNKRETPTRQTTTFCFVRPLSVALAGLMTFAFVTESSAAFGFGGMRSFGGARSFGAMHATNMRPMRATNMQAIGNVGRTPGRIGRIGGDGRTPGKLGNNPGRIDRNPGKVVSRDPHGPRTPHYPHRPGGRYPGYPIIPSVPLTPGPGVISGGGVPPTIDQMTTPPGGGQGAGQGSGQTAQRPGFNPPPPGETRFVGNEVLLHLPAGTSTSAFLSITRRNRLTQLDQREFSMTGRRLARVRINDGRAVASVIQSLQTEAGIAGAQPNYLYALEQDADPPAGPPQYPYRKLHLSRAHALAKGERVRVAVIDTMIDAAHPDLAGAVVGTFDATGAAAKPHLHGTGVAGVIAAHGTLTGAAPSVQILAVTSFSQKQSWRGTSFDVLTGMDWSGTAKADIVNMSFSGAADPETHIMVKALRQKGIVLIAAAGNNGPKADPAYPAAYPEVIAVTATDSDDNLFEKANRGSYIAVAAPGVDVLVPSPGGSYQMRTGTSFAAPQVSGIAALLLERNRKLDPVAIRNILTTTARDLGPPGLDDQFGAGLVDAVTALESAGEQSTEVSARRAQPSD
jgi:subtilisin family serine protease